MFSINGIVYLTWLLDASTIGINSYYLLKNDRKIPESKEFSKNLGFVANQKDYFHIHATFLIKVLFFLLIRSGIRLG